MVQALFNKFFGSKHDRDVKKIKPLIEQINEYNEEYHDLSADALKAKTEEFKKRLADDETVEDLLPEAFAAVKEACRRLVGQRWEVAGIETEWDMVPYDVQLVGGVVLHQGKIAEMATGEGKTLVATLPLYLNALTGKGVHLVTVNDYLARRDSEWMGKIFETLGLTVGCIQNDMDPETRRKNYGCDITYGTNNEFGFDYLRDNMAVRVEDRVHRNFHYAIVDEVDSVLVDEARTPLIIAGPVAHQQDERYTEMRPLIERLHRRQADVCNKLVAEGEKLWSTDEYEAAIKLLAVKRGAPKNKRYLKFIKEQGVKKAIARVEADYTRDKRMDQIDDLLYYALDERGNTIELTENGLNSLEPQEQDIFIIPDIGTEIVKLEEREDLNDTEMAREKDKIYRVHSERSEKVHNVSQLLKAYTLFEKDVEYVVQEGRVMIVDEFTGRLMPGRRYSDGLHQAIEAKERVKIEGETQTLATITLQNYFRLYDKLGGMTGTAVTEAAELFDIYKLDVTSIPTNKPIRRIDFDDVILRTRGDKYNAIIEEIARLNEAGRPILVGTVSVDVSEMLSRMLNRKGIKHNVLNAKQHQSEAEIVQFAGRRGAVTIATNMAGRGTDIKLGQGVVKHPHCALVATGGETDVCPHVEELKCREDVPCGLQIIGTERHEARRIDRQLRGRSGRQGDPGASRFFLSLEDDLMRLFGSERIATVMDKLGVKEGEVIEHSMVTKSIERAQKKVEGQNFSIRKHLLEYDDVMNQQREVIYDRRAAALEREDMKEEVLEMIDKVAEEIIEQHCPDDAAPEQWETGALKNELFKTFLVDLKFADQDFESISRYDLKEKVQEMARANHANKEKALGEQLMRQLEKFAILRVTDEHWREHLYEMDQLKQGIGLRAYGQRNPLIEFKKEAFGAFAELVQTIDREAVSMVYRMQVAAPETQVPQPRAMTEVHEAADRMGYREAPEEARKGGKKKPMKRQLPKVGRNDPCPCGSGKKYKKCHGVKG
ncbi:preprotein translocase subunit SecA [Candidatus Zixiibacteriota bacterium]